MFEFLTALEIDVRERTAAGEAYVPASHPEFADHFPGAPLLPGTWTLELMQQVAQPLVEAVNLQMGKNVRVSLAGVEIAKIERPVPLPAHLVIKARVSSLDSGAATVHVEALEGRARCGVAELAMRLGANQDAGEVRRAPLALAAVERALAIAADRVLPRELEGGT